MTTPAYDVVVVGANAAGASTAMLLANEAGAPRRRLILVPLGLAALGETKLPVARDCIRTAMARGQALPPVELYQLGFGYYVLDGHHRVAAARLQGQLALDANVVRFVPAIAVDAAHIVAASAGLAGQAGGSSSRAHGHGWPATHTDQVTAGRQQQNRDYAQRPHTPRITR